ncbi:MAG TPA: LPS assembly protein LptD [Bryobacteraceae bacterium]|nr:LPS assembly protein LptD [Bryobacteraceae bacterium]
MGLAPVSAQTTAALQPNQPLNTARPNAPPRGRWNFTAVTQEADGKMRKLHGRAEVEGSTMLFQADDIEYNEDTGDLHATGHVFYQNFDKKERVWADRLEYNTDSEAGKFYNVHGETQPHIEARPGILTSSNPFYFEGDWAERQGDKYILHNGFVTNCQIPSPWWTLRGPRFDIIPGERAIAYHSVFRIRGLPLFYTPFFYKSLEREPRKSGFLLPNIGHSSVRGMMVGLGYFWAINRSYDLTYRFQEYTARGEAQHFDFRGKPRAGTDYDAIVYAVRDRGVPQPSGPPLQYGGVNIYATGKSDLGDGWNARAQVNYTSSFRFRQNWSESFSELIGSEVQSVGFLNKNWSNYTFNLAAARLQNFQSSEIETIDPVTLATHFETNAVTVRKLPEAQLSQREDQLFSGVPLWYSFDSAAGLLYREEPFFTPAGTLVDRYQTGQFMKRVDFTPHLMSAFHFAGFHLVPRIGIDEAYYSESQAFNPSASTALNRTRYQVIGTNLVRSSRDFSVDLIFPPLARVFSKKTIFGDKLKHVIEPRVTYDYIGGIGNDFTRFIRFDENDLLANTNELQLSLTNRIYAKRGDAVTEIFSWQLWQSRYFDPTFGGALVPGQRNTFLSTAELTPYSFLINPRSTSPVASILRISPLNGLGIEWRADYDHRQGRVVDSTVSLDYRWSKYFVSVGNNRVKTDPILTTPANQFRFRVGFGDPNHRGWNAGVDGVYDFDQGPNYNQARLLYSTAQVTYNTNCCGISVELHRFSFGNRNENQFRVAFAVSNIATFGTLRRQDRLF